MFEEYAMLNILNTIQFTKCKRTDIVFDVYLPSSLKAESGSKRGRGVKRWVTRKGTIPSNWQNFLRENNKKDELFNFLADKITRVATPNVVILTKEKDAVSNCTISLAGVAPCSHEEAATRVFVHARHATEAGSKVIMVKANETKCCCHCSQCSEGTSGARFVGCLCPRTEPEVGSCTWLCVALLQ